MSRKGNLTVPGSSRIASERLIVPRRKPLTARIGIFGVGMHMYWPQFPGLKDELLGHLRYFVEEVRKQEVEVIDFGLVDDAPSTYALGRMLQAAELDLVFCDMLTYATSVTFGTLVRGLRCPIVLVALQPLARMDYDRATTYLQLCNDNICSLPEFAGVAVRMGKKVPPTIIGTLRDDPVAWAEVSRWCNIAKALHDLKRARIGHFGHPIEAMLDMHSDLTMLTAAFGLHVVQTEADTRGHFSPNAREFLTRWIAEGPTHHFALGVGHHGKTIRQIADILGIEAVIV